MPASRHMIGLWCLLGAVILAALAVWLAPWGLLLVWLAASMAIVAGGYLGLGTAVFVKRRGRIHPAARLLHGPYLASLSLWRMARHEGSAHDCVAPGIRLGRMVSSNHARRLIDQGVRSALDLTCEHSEAGPLLAIVYVVSESGKSGALGQVTDSAF
jgi:protein phosphatase